MENPKSKTPKESMMQIIYLAVKNVTCTRETKSCILVYVSAEFIYGETRQWVIHDSCMWSGGEMWGRQGKRWRDRGRLGEPKNWPHARLQSRRQERSHGELKENLGKITKALNSISLTISHFHPNALKASAAISFPHPKAGVWDPLCWALKKKKQNQQPFLAKEAYNALNKEKHNPKLNLNHYTPKELRL